MCIFSFLYMAWSFPHYHNLGILTPTRPPQWHSRWPARWPSRDASAWHSRSWTRGFSGGNAKIWDRKISQRSWENVGKMRFEAGNIWKIEGLKLPREWKPMKPNENGLFLVHIFRQDLLILGKLSKEGKFSLSRLDFRSKWSFPDLPGDKQNIPARDPQTENVLTCWWCFSRERLSAGFFQ